MEHFQKLTMILFLIFLSLISRAQDHEISITVNGLAGEDVIVGYHLGKQRLVYDTLRSSESGELLIKGEGALPPGVYFLYANTFYFEFLVKEQRFNLLLDKETAYSSLEVEGSVENQLFADFQRQMGVLQRQQRELADSLKIMTGEDSVQIRERYIDLVNEMSGIRSSMVRTHQGTFFAEFLGLMVGLEVPPMDSIQDDTERRIAQYLYYQNHYLDPVNKPEEIIRTPVIHDYVMKYFMEVVVPQPDSINVSIDRFMSRMSTDHESFRYWLVTLFNHYQDSKIMGMDAVTVHLAENYYLSGKANWVTEKAKTDIQKEMRFMKPNLIGQPAPDMILVDSAFSPFFISKIPDDYLVLFFYDPECGTCRKKTPILLEAYDELKEEGADVVAICTITDTSKWKDYIKKNNMQWYNVGDPQGKSNFRVDYNVRSVPQVYVLDKQRKIIAKKLDVSQVVGFIKDHRSLQTR